MFFFFFSSRRRHTRCREVSWARRCVQETASVSRTLLHNISAFLASSRRSCNSGRTLLLSFASYPQNSQQASSSSILVSISFLLCIVSITYSKVTSKGDFSGTPKQSSPTVSYTHLTLPTILLVQISVVAVSLKKKNKKKDQLLSGLNKQKGTQQTYPKQ
eukprot:TRINITY_DN19462_c0_g1_i2.p1 TRINITY_DN19462_c0_g1~~TRINITY_DN19462_c0_g1_i2.p1  ORF type:complete len:160 (+),score=34.04 TRINITY_DN19462_c0_g1_i2:116-595(+)